MTTIFISGSREISFIPDEVTERVNRIINSGFDIVVGDSERGVDVAIIRYLESCAYENVSVYTVHDRPRVKGILDAWNIRKIVPTATAKTDKAGNVRNRRELETAKDQAMGALADYGLVIWQSTYMNRFGNMSVSKGSLRNMYQLLSARRPVVLYKAPSADFDVTPYTCHELRSLEDLKTLVSTEPSVVARSYAEIEKAALRDGPSLFV